MNCSCLNLSMETEHSNSQNMATNENNITFSNKRDSKNITVRKKTTEKEAVESSKLDYAAEIRNLRQEVSMLRDHLETAISLIHSCEVKIDAYSDRIFSIFEKVKPDNCPVHPKIITKENVQLVSKKSKLKNANKNKNNKKTTPIPSLQSLEKEKEKSSKNSVSPNYKPDELQPVQRKKHPTTVCGAASPSVTTLKAVQPRRFLHLWNMESSVEEVRGYLQQLCPGSVCVVEELKARGNYKSYKIEVPAICFDTCLSAEVWPINAKIKIWKARTTKPVGMSQTRLNPPFRDTTTPLTSSQE
ncbi:unnamed protein product [Leptosia nina]|uniref:Uncharacterized protein n=1 Tax=Leptosia nina TaxID=320188 RepID=A0AAV1JA18_9NEOP